MYKFNNLLHTKLLILIITIISFKINQQSTSTTNKETHTKLTTALIPDK